jgi:hypothetical protein
MIKNILRQTVDLIFGLIALGLLIAWVVNPTNNFTGFLTLVVGYVSFNVISKVRLIMDPDLLKKRKNG